MSHDGFKGNGFLRLTCSGAFESHERLETTVRVTCLSKEQSMGQVTKSHNAMLYMHDKLKSKGGKEEKEKGKFRKLLDLYQIE